MTLDLPPMVMPTERKLLAFLAQCQATGPARPGYREMADAVGFPSVSSLVSLIAHLEKRGFIRRLPGLPRSVEVLRQPGGPVPDPKVAAVEALIWKEARVRNPSLAQRIVAVVLAP